MPALLLALALMATDAPPQAPGEPLPPGAPTDGYQLSAWCYGALSEYLDVYDRVKPDLIAIDKQYGSSVPNEKQPYASDMAAARRELKVIARSVEAAEQASPTPLQSQGLSAINRGRAIWAPAEGKTRRELARAWLTWALPDTCASNARELTAKSALLGSALKYNNPSAIGAPGAAPVPAAPDAAAPDAPPPAPPPPEAAPDAPPPNPQ
jgi:hypothetical protein